jgi:DNA-binding NarL/FixJ family response regulator
VDNLMPDVVMTDISMPGMDGITAISHIHAKHPQVKLLVLSMYDTVDFVKRAVANGACGYLMKDAPPFELEQAVRSVMATGSYFSPSIAQRLLQPSEPTVDDELTHRQVEILRLIAQGRASKEIAYELGLSPKTVDVHRARIMERLHLNDIASLTLYAVRKGLIKP